MKVCEALNTIITHREVELNECEIAKKWLITCRFKSFHVPERKDVVNAIIACINWMRIVKTAIKLFKQNLTKVALSIINQLIV